MGGGIEEPSQTPALLGKNDFFNGAKFNIFFKNLPLILKEMELKFPIP